MVVWIEKLKLEERRLGHTKVVKKLARKQSSLCIVTAVVFGMTFFENKSKEAKIVAGISALSHLDNFLFFLRK